MDEDRRLGIGGCREELASLLRELLTGERCGEGLLFLKDFSCLTGAGTFCFTGVRDLRREPERDRPLFALSLDLSGDF